MNAYEFPLPKLSVDIESLEIETKSLHNGNFSVKNVGGGVLKGKIISRCAGLFFEPDEFEGATKINFSFNAATAGLGIGEAIRSKFFVTSNGGEKEIPVSAKLIKMSLTAPDGQIIANIRDFFEYSKKNPSQARRLFIDSEFYMLLLATGYEFMEVYESLHKDANRERATDNFFVLSGLKKQTEMEIFFPSNETSESENRDETAEFSDFSNQPPPKNETANEKILEFVQMPGDSRKIYGEFKIKKSDGGYVDAPLIFDAPWLKLSSGKLSSADFDEENIATVDFTIDPRAVRRAVEISRKKNHATSCEKNISTQNEKFAARDVEISHEKNHTTRDEKNISTQNEKFAAHDDDDFFSSQKNIFVREKIFIGAEKKISLEIIYRRLPPLVVKLSRDAYRYADKGFIEIFNNTGMNMKIDVFCPENYIRFSARSYPVGARGEISFDVKLSTFLNAQMLFRKLPYMRTIIELKAKIPGQEIKKTLPIIIGEW
ncbi:MAG: DUF5717 family protein [Defluviitaleaceae bacterium]|nr:DUF5717 family protein [Defluviitaleaceae bacterium]